MRKNILGKGRTVIKALRQLGMFADIKGEQGQCIPESGMSKGGECKKKRFSKVEDRYRSIMARTIFLL